MTAGINCGIWALMGGRLPVLDGFRAIAVLIVMASHAFTSLIPGGFGVTIFFFLSGYLITTIMVREWRDTGDVDFAIFYLKRVVRIIPPMLIAIGFTLILSTTGLVSDVDSSALWWDFPLFLTNYAPQVGSVSNTPIPLWSLDVEEHFYLIFPLVFVLLHRRNWPVALCLAVLCGLILTIRIAHVVNSGPTTDIFYWSHTRIDSILFGCILATWNNPATGDRTIIGDHIGYAISGGILLLATLVVRNPVFRETIRYSIQGVGLLLVFNYALRSKSLLTKLLANRVFGYIAAISYFLYLIHMSLLEAASHIGVAAPVALIASVLFAEGVRRFVELPLLHWRKRIETQSDVKVSAI